MRRTSRKNISIFSFSSPLLLWQATAHVLWLGDQNVCGSSAWGQGECRVRGRSDQPPETPLLRSRKPNSSTPPWCGRRTCLSPVSVINRGRVRTTPYGNRKVRSHPATSADGFAPGLIRVVILLASVGQRSILRNGFALTMRLNCALVGRNLPDCCQPPWRGVGSSRPIRRLARPVPSHNETRVQDGSSTGPVAKPRRPIDRGTITRGRQALSSIDMAPARNTTQQRSRKKAPAQHR